MPNYIAKIVNNTNSWERISSIAQCGVQIRNKKYFGFEEWLTNPVLKTKKLGYLDCYRYNRFPEITDKIALIRAEHGIVYHVGTLHNVSQIEESEIAGIRQELNQSDWLTTIQNNFQLGTEFQEFYEQGHYRDYYESGRIQARDQKPHFIVNIRYERLEMLNIQNNITQVCPIINNRRRITIRYREINCFTF